MIDAVIDTKPGAGFVRKLLLSVVFALLLVGLAEISFRWIIFPEWKLLSQRLHVEHPVYLRFNAPNVSVRQFDPPSFDAIVTTNAGGFRDRRIGFEKDLAGIWVCGGSTTFGSGIEDDDIFAAKLEEYGYRIANLSAEGSQIVIESRVIRDLARRGHRPRAVICVITTPGGIKPFGDQLGEFDRPLPENGAGRRTTDKSAIRVLTDTIEDVLPANSPGYLFSGIALKTRLVKNSAIYGAVKFGVGRVPALHKLSLDLGLRRDADLHMSGRPGLFAKELNTKLRERIDGMAAFTARLDKWIQDYLGVPFSIVILPSHHQIHPEKFAKYLRHTGRRAVDYDINLANSRFIRALRDRGLKVLDASPALIAANDRSLTFANNAHLNRAGHAIVARSIAGWLEDELDISPTR